MAITVTQILGTDSISGSRIIINDNFAILRDEINALETYLDPSAGTLENLNSLQSKELHVGVPGNFLMEITATVFEINTDVEFTSPTAYLTLNGLMNHNSFGVIKEIDYTGSKTLDPVSTEGFRNYSIVHTSTSDFVIELLKAKPGQDLTFFLEQKGAGSVYIMAAPSATLVLDGSPNNKISLNDIGSTVTVRMMVDSSGNEVYYVSSHNNVTYTT